MNSRQQGFSLIELMVAVAIVAILAAIAVPAYDGVIRKANRSEARDELLRIAGQQEKFYTSNNRYTDNPSVLGIPADGKTPHDAYTLTVDVTGGGQGFLITATPVGNQTKDTTCGTLTYNNLGQKTASGTSSDPLRECW